MLFKAGVSEFIEHVKKLKQGLPANATLAVAGWFCEFNCFKCAFLLNS
jgi:uncharacterized radical SAM superfamily protein